jgi:DNA-binding transcriptional LysR family regulator
MEMHQVRYFLAAAQNLNFTRAAETCHVSQPALTTAIKKLEGELGGQLFFREANRLQLTEFGRQMAPMLGQIAERAKAAVATAESLRMHTRAGVRVGVMPTLGPANLARFLADFERAHPGNELSVSEGRVGDLGTLLETDMMDVAILTPLDNLGESFRTEALYTERYVVLLPPDHPLKESNGLRLAELADVSYVDRLSCEMRGVLMSVCGQMGITLNARFRSEREDWVQAMVAAGLGFALMPEYSVTHPGTIQRPLLEPAVQREVALVTKPGRRPAQAVDSFLRAARNHRWLG